MMRLNKTFNITKVRRSLIFIVTFFLMLLFYPVIEEVVLVSEENKSAREIVKDINKSQMELFISKVDNIELFKKKILELSENLDVEFFFTSYDSGSTYVINLYALFTSQESLDLLPITPHIDLETFNTLDEAITNNSNQSLYRINTLPTSRYEIRYRSFVNYNQRDFVGETIISGNQEAIDLFLSNLSNFDGVVYSYDKLDNFEIPKELLLFLQIKHFFVSLLQNYNLQLTFIVTLLLTSISVYLQKRRLSVYKMHGYSYFAVLKNLLRDSLLYVVLGIIFSFVPSLLVYQKGFYQSGLKVAPLFLLVGSAIVFINLIILCLSSLSIYFIRVESTLKRKAKNDYLTIGGFFLKALIVIMITLTISDTLDIWKTYSDFNITLNSYLRDISNEYQLDVKSLKSLPQLYQAMKKNIEKVANNKHSIYSDFQVFQDRNVVKANLGFIRSLNLSNLQDESISLDDENWKNTALVTEDNYEFLKNSLQKSPILCGSNQENCSHFNIIVVKKKKIFPPFEYYLQGSLPFDSFILLPATEINSPNDIFFIATTPTALEEEIYPEIEQDIDTKQLKFINRLELFESRRDEIQSSLFKKITNLILSILIFVFIYLFLLITYFSTLSKRIAVNKLLGNGPWTHYLAFLLEGTLFTTLIIGLLLSILKVSFHQILIIVALVLAIEILVFVISFYLIDRNTSSLIKSSLEE